VTDFRGNELCLLSVEVLPCDQKGKEFNETYQMVVDNPKDLINKDLYFKLKIIGANGLPPRFNDVFCKYKFFKENDYNETAVVRAY
jgi:kinesin family protein 1